MTKEVKQFIERHRFMINNFKPTEILQIAVSISIISDWTDEELKEIVRRLNKANCCNKPIIAFDEDKKIYNCLNCKKVESKE